MFKIVFIVLLKITLAMLPYDEYGGYGYISEDMASPATPVSEDPMRHDDAKAAELLKVQANIQKLLGGRILPRALSDPTRQPSLFEGVVETGTQANIQAAIPATEEHVYIGATRPSKFFPKNVEAELLKQKVDELNRIEELYRWMPNVPRRNFIKTGREAGNLKGGIVAREGEIPETIPEDLPADGGELPLKAEEAVKDAEDAGLTLRSRATTSTTTRRTRSTSTITTTPTPVCIDELGYRVRCTNATKASTTTLRSRRRKTKPTQRTKKSRRTTTLTTTPTPTITTFSTTMDPNATTVNMTGVNTTVAPTTTTTTQTTTTMTTTETETMETTLTTKRTRRLPWIRRSTVREPNDIDRILMILDNLTYIYDTDVVDRLNETLELEGYPYCPTVRTRVTTTTTPKSWPMTEDTGKVIAKCFVCGMDVPGIPRESQCADAFAPDYLPGASLIYAPTHVSRYKKHCKYLDMPTWHVNGTEGRSMWGKWDGGCSVRWVDISGVYTQRSCRARHKPAIGRHFVSKRLAKMEYALNMMDNGCIGSAQASLVPFSRGISLFARFYACVCTGTYCNAARRLRAPLWCIGLAVAVLR
ncbi:uncharacterized protein [Choristoneura fumiferana]|uniref:uncharacterized protein n=1 Tax=Choristoneura fumiferana TaxID=7141 RepID=UPI003D155870